MQDSVNTTTDYLSRFWANIIDALPSVIGAIIILIIAYLVAKALQILTVRMFHGIDLNKRIRSLQGGTFIRRAVPNPTNFLSRVVYWLVFLLGLSMAISVLGIPVLNDFLRSVYAYIPNIIAAVLIFMVASAVSAAVVGLATRTMGNTPTGKVVATAVPVIVMSIAVFMILNQLNIASEIVTITYAALLGSASLGMALAFGLGGREVAGRILEDLYEKGRGAKAQAKIDLKRSSAKR